MRKVKNAVKVRRDPPEQARRLGEREGGDHRQGDRQDDGGGFQRALEQQMMEELQKQNELLRRELKRAKKETMKKAIHCKK